MKRILALATVISLSLLPAFKSPVHAAQGRIVESGYTDFADGQFGNSGQNIYVSKSGVLQRIHRFDFNGDGWNDVLFVDAHDFNETPPSFVYGNVFGQMKVTELPALVISSEAIGDVNGDGYDDLVIANRGDGAHSDVTSYLYFGSASGLSERLRMEFPTPDTRSVAIGDFNGDGRTDIAFALEKKLRIFFRAKDRFLPGVSTDFDANISDMASADLDGDGYCDLYVKDNDGQPAILWGGKDGIDTAHPLNVGDIVPMIKKQPGDDRDRIDNGTIWLPKVVKLDSVPYVFRPLGNGLALYPVSRDRSLGKPVQVDCANAVTVGAGDVNGDGRQDLAVAVSNSRRLRNSSLVYMGTANGFGNDNKVELSTLSARDVAVRDLDGDGCDDVAIAQGNSFQMMSTESLVFKGGRTGMNTAPVHVKTNDCLMVLAGKTSADKNPQLIFANLRTGRLNGDVMSWAYYGGPKGFSPDRRTGLLSWSAASALCCDFTGDGKADILLSNNVEDAMDLDPGSFLYVGGKDGLSNDRRVILPTKHAWAAVTGDFRHSGYLDVATVGWDSGEMLIFHGTEGGFDTEHPEHINIDADLARFTRQDGVDKPQTKGELQQVRKMLAADFNNDGWLDIFVNEIEGTRSFIMWGGPQGFNMDRTTSLAAEGANIATAADLNGDGRLDLIVGGFQALSKQVVYESYIYIYWGRQGGYSDEYRTQLPCYSCGGLAVADFNNDGILDIFTASYHAGRTRDIDSYLYWGQPGGVYSPKYRSRFFNNSASGCMAADFNKDGWVDIAVAVHRAYGDHNAQSNVWWNGPKGFNEANVTKLPSTGPHGMLILDTGNLMDRSQEEYYTSSPLSLPANAVVNKVGWKAELQKGTWVKMQLRFASTKEGLETAPWIGAEGPGSWFKDGQSVRSADRQGQWIQYRLSLGAENGGNSPLVKSVEIDYTK